MIKVITYGTFDLLHYGHLNLLKRAKALGDYLIVGITSDDFDFSRGKINVQQSLMQRIENVQKTGLADEIIIEEYEGQKIDDIKRYGVDIFTVGSDWKGKFDYLNEYCKVVYLDRTEGVSSSEIRSDQRKLRLGIVGNVAFIPKVIHEANFVNGMEISGIYSRFLDKIPQECQSLSCITSNYDQLLDKVDAVYILSNPQMHFELAKKAIGKGKHVLIESPVVTKKSDYDTLSAMADKEHVLLVESLKTAYSMAYSRLLLLVKSGEIGDVFSVDSTCTSLRNINFNNSEEVSESWNSICSWGPTAMLPIFQILGTKYSTMKIVTHFGDEAADFDDFSNVVFTYPHAVASVKVGKGVKSEGELIISGSKGYVYVPAPWWKTDYFEIRYENPLDNKRFFYELSGEGIRYELVEFVKAIQSGKKNKYIDSTVTETIVKVIDSFYQKKNLIKI
jgi:choline-phosphate cytidylyltransferase